MNYTYLAIAGAALLIFLSIYFFTSEKKTSLSTVGCRSIRKRNECSGKNELSLHYNSLITTPSNHKDKLSSFVCCKDKESAVNALKELKHTTLLANLIAINKLVGVTVASNSVMADNTAPRASLAQAAANSTQPASATPPRTTSTAFPWMGGAVGMEI